MPPRRNTKHDATASKQGHSSGGRGLAARENSSDEESFEDFVRSKLTDLIKSMTNLEERLAASIELNSERIGDLEESEKEQNKKIAELTNQVNTLSGTVKQQAASINRNERFARRNNFRLVGVRAHENENCVEIVKEVLQENFEWEGVPRIERAHRDRPRNPEHNRAPHILVKMLSYQDKLKIMKEARQSLESTPWYVLDDLTPDDLKEKKKWKDQVKRLYDAGTKLRFVAGRWRTREGGVYRFPGNEDEAGAQ